MNQKCSHKNFKHFMCKHPCHNLEAGRDSDVNSIKVWNFTELMWGNHQFCSFHSRVKGFRLKSLKTIYGRLGRKILLQHVKNSVFTEGNLGCDPLVDTVVATSASTGQLPDFWQNVYFTSFDGNWRSQVVWKLFSKLLNWFLWNNSITDFQKVLICSFMFIDQIERFN